MCLCLRLCEHVWVCNTYATGCHADAVVTSPLPPFPIPLPQLCSTPLLDSPALGVFDFMAFVCRWRQFDACNLSCPRFPSIFSIGRATQHKSKKKKIKKIKNKWSFWHVVASLAGCGNPREREGDREGLLFINRMLYVISNLCSKANRGAEPSPRLKWQHPLDVATLQSVGNSSQLDLRIPTRL